MQKCLNRWQGIGYVGKEPEVRMTPKGTSVCNISLACSRTWKDASGEKQERTDWIPVVAWDKLADLVGQYVHKGQLIMVEGSLQYRDSEKDGVTYQRGDVVMTDIIFLRSKEGHVRSDGARPSPEAGSRGRGLPSVGDDEIPF
jgi:single-strand DNA-binding protein